MFERFIWYASIAIPTAVAAWIGLAAFLTGLKRFDVYLKFPLWLLFFVLWVIATFTGFFGGSSVTKTHSIIAVSALIIGILFYLVSLPLRKKIERGKPK